MTRIDDTKCPSCAHYREQQFAPTPTCAKAPHPRGKGLQVACVIAWTDWCGEGRRREKRR